MSENRVCFSEFQVRRIIDPKWRTKPLNTDKWLDVGSVPQTPCPLVQQTDHAACPFKRP
jgi:hypothetical protein